MNKKIYWAFPLISGGLFGSVGIFVRKLEAFGIDNYTSVFSRVSIAALILFGSILLFDKNLLKIKLQDLWLFVATGLLGMLGLNYFYNESLSRLTLSFSAVLLSLSPIFVLILSVFLFKERVNLTKILSMGLAIIGCFFASGILNNSAQLKWTPLGIIIGLAAAFFYALFSIFSKMAMNRNYNVFTITFYSLLTCSIALLPLINWSILGSFIVDSPIENSAFLILHALCTSVLPYILYTVSLKYIDTSKAAILAAGGEPMSAMIFGIFFFSEVPTLLSFSGIIITIIALSIFCKPNSPSLEKEYI